MIKLDIKKIISINLLFYKSKQKRK